MDTSGLPIARIEGLSHTYKAVRALDQVTVDIPSGMMVGLLGPDGVGKSTLLGLLAGARKIQQGQITVFGGNMRSSRHRRKTGPRIAYMPQGLGKNLYQDLSIRENLDFFSNLYGQGRKEGQVRIDRLTKATGLHPFLDRPVAKLSGGMKQKLGLCCALIHDPDFLVLDEPTTGVDPLSRRQFWELMDNIRAERPLMSVLVSTAYMDEAERLDWLIAMNAGKILDCGTPDELKQKTGAGTIETAFVRLLPDERGKARGELVIPPIEKQEGKAAIVARNLTRRFGDFTAVDQVSFEIQEGEIFGFLGSNGCGKTTVMKMLTGLLPASEGEAYLFGKPVNAKDLETRKRVGFMSQAFSLYGELTVSQNLDLHAHLFHLSANKAADRIKYLVQRFNLTDYKDQLASSLPLGMRQRLSLAVAIIHEPEMLILDEPTSGVDPVARDEFWEMLVELSRRDKVTIFISTHFMNEALRCDRISLMHAGQVLVYDEPDHLIKEKGADTLEDAFISYIQEAIGNEEPAASDTVSSLSLTQEKTAGVSVANRQSVSAFSLRRLLALSYREMIEVMRDPVRLAFAFIGSMVLLVIMVYGVSQDVEDLTYAVMDLDQTPESRQYLMNYRGSQYFLEQDEITSKEDMDRRLRSNDITLAIEIPPGFGRALKKGNRTEVSAWIDGANTNRASTIEGYVAGVHRLFLADLILKSSDGKGLVQHAKAEPRYRYNPSFESIYAVGPAIPAMLLLLFPAILMAVSIAREKEIGTITNFYVTPTNRVEFLVGKQLPYIAIGMVNFAILTLVVVFVLQVPIKGSLPVLALGALLYVSASTGFGLLISSITKSQVAAVFATAILSVMPTIQFSGMMQPVSTLEAGGRLMGEFWPTTYYIHLSVGVFTKGLGLADLTGDLIALSLFTPVFVLAAAIFLKKQEA